MDWLNIHTSVLDSEDFLGCEPVDQATWVKLMRYCIGQENGGRIVTDKAWGDRRWQQVFRVTLEEAHRNCPLWSWDGDVLTVSFYPEDKEAEVQAKRTGGHYGGKAATKAKADAARDNGAKGGRPSITQAEPKVITQAEPKVITQAEPKVNPTERKGKEGKGREEAETQAPTPEHDPAEVIGPPSKPPPPPPAPPRITGRDLLATMGGMLAWFRSRDGRQEAEADMDGALVLATQEEIRKALLERFQSTGEKIRTQDVAGVVKAWRCRQALEVLNRIDPVVERGMQVARRIGPDALRARFGFTQPNNEIIMAGIHENMEVMRELAAEA